MIKNAIFFAFSTFFDGHTYLINELNLSDVKSQFPSARLSLIFI